VIMFAFLALGHAGAAVIGDWCGVDSPRNDDQSPQQPVGVNTRPGALAFVAGLRSSIVTALAPTTSAPGSTPFLSAVLRNATHWAEVVRARVRAATPPRPTSNRTHGRCRSTRWGGERTMSGYASLTTSNGGALRVIEVEAWALRVIDRVQRGVPIEDSRVELKADWPEDSNKAARRIAGHCNASAGDRVLWLIGVSEVSGVVGANPNDMATWWPQVKSEFDGQVPYIRDVSLTLSTAVVVALLFETDRAPFVVRNAVHGALSGCSASGVAGLSSPGMWFCGDLGQAAAGTPTASFQAVNRVSISWR
jgi:hypothetical protein